MSDDYDITDELLEGLAEILSGLNSVNAAIIFSVIKDHYIHNNDVKNKLTNKGIVIPYNCKRKNDGIEMDTDHLPEDLIRIIIQRLKDLEN